MTTESTIPPCTQRELLEKMMLARKFELQLQTLFDQGIAHGTTHLGVGEEGAAIGTVLGIQPEDYILVTHRGHAQALAKGLDVNAMMAEILAKSTGTCHGKGGSMHIADIDAGVLVANGILGSSAPIACGAALTMKRRGENRIAVCFFGDGSANLGAVHEAMNLAAVWNLPVLFVLINNTYGISTHISKASRDTDLAKRAIPFDMPAETLDGNDVLAVYDAARRARDYVAAHGPMLLVENTYRISGHSKNDANLYRSREEIETWRKACPILRLERHMLATGLFTHTDISDIDKRTTDAIQAALEYGENSPEPSIDTILTHIYA